MFHVEHLFSVFLSLTTFYVEHFSLPFSHNVPRGTFLSAFLSQRSTWNISLCLSLTTFYVEHFPLPFSLTTFYVEHSFLPFSLTTFYVEHFPSVFLSQRSMWNIIFAVVQDIPIVQKYPQVKRLKYGMPVQ